MDFERPYMPPGSYYTERPYTPPGTIRTQARRGSEASWTTRLTVALFVAALLMALGLVLLLYVKYTGNH